MAAGGFYLKGVVKREPVEENVREELAQTEDAVHHPVRQPFCVVLFAGAFDGFDSADGVLDKFSGGLTNITQSYEQNLTNNTRSRVIRWIDETNQVAEEGGTISIHQVESGQ